MIARARAWTYVLAIALASGGFTATARAQPPAADADRAAALYDEGSKLLKDGNAGASLAPLEQSMVLLASPNTELLIGHALRELGKKARAVERYVHVRETAKARVAAGEARFSRTLEDAEHWISKLAPDVTDLSVNVTNAPADAELVVNDRRVAWMGTSGGVRSARTYEEPGRVVVEVRSEGRAIGRAEEKVPAGAMRVVTLELPAGDEKPSLATTNGGGVDPPPVAAWIAGGIGAAGMISFAVAGGIALTKAGELEACAPSCDAGDPALQDARDTGKTSALVANVSVAIGGAGLIAGTLLWIFWPDDKPATSSVSLDVGPTYLGVRGQF